MKKRVFNVSILISCILFFTQCEKEKFDYPTAKGIEINRTVSQSNAKNFVGLLGNQLLNSKSKLKSASTGTRAIESIDIVTEGADTLLYITNFSNDLGFMILSAEKTSFPIVAFSDSGSFNVNKLDSASTEWLRIQKLAMQEKRSIPLDTSNNYYQLWDKVELCKADTGFVLSLEIDENNSNLKSTTSTKQDIFPLCYMTQWGQGYGYNYYCPLVSPYNYDYYGNKIYYGTAVKAPVGCVAVAMGQVMYTYWEPYNWSFMSMFLGPTPNDLTSDLPNQTARMLRDIGIAVNMSYDYYGSGIPATEPNRIVNAFKNTFGYSSGGEVISYDFEKVYNSIYYGNPVILLGVGSNGGHAWVADGYKNVKIHVIEKKKFLGITISTKEYDIYKDYLHMNWGWNGESNGYYEHTDWKTFGTTKKAVINIHP